LQILKLTDTFFYVIPAVQVLFPESYQHTREWLHTVVDPAEDALYAAQQQLLAALDADPRFQQLAAGCVVSGLHVTHRY
jgi:hypothetical protein